MNVTRYGVMLMLLAFGGLCGGCFTVRTSDNLHGEGAKGYVLFYQAPTYVGVPHVTTRVHRAEDGREELIGPIVVKAGGWPADYHARRVACRPGTATFVVEVGHVRQYPLKSDFETGTAERREVKVNVLPGIVVPVRVAFQPADEVPGYDTDYQWDVVVEDPRPEGWEPGFIR